MRCFAAFVIAIAFGVPASAQTPDMDTCAGSSGTAAERIAACNRAIATQGVSAEDRSRAYYNRALEWAGQGDHDRAIADYNDAIRLNPRYADAYLNRGITRARKGEFGAGIQDLTQVIQLNPRYAEAYYWRSIMAGRTGDNKLAMADFDAAAKLNPTKYKSSPAQPADVFTCFNDSGTGANAGAIGLWAYEGQTDLNAARQAGGPTLVIGFPAVQGGLVGKDFAPKELLYCNFIANPKTQTASPCSSGSIHIARMEPQTSLAGEYRFLIENGQVKALKFTASYCPRAKPASQK